MKSEKEIRNKVKKLESVKNKLEKNIDFEYDDEDESEKTLLLLLVMKITMLEWVLDK